MQKTESISEIQEFHPGSSERFWESQTDKLALQTYRIICFMVKRSLSQEEKWRKAQVLPFRPVTWFVWDWVKGVLKRILNDYRHKLQGKHVELPRKNLHIIAKVLSKNCPLTHHSWHVISFLPSTTAFTNISETNWCCFDPPEFLLQIHFTSRNHWGHLDRGFHFSFLWKEFCLHPPKPRRDSNQYEATGDNGGLASELHCSKPNAYCRHAHSSPVHTM